MTTVAAGPYREAQFFDTTGTPPGFCPDCEHAPCVAGYKGRCSRGPRSIVVGAMREEIFDLLDKLYANPLWGALRMAVYSISDTARAVHGGTLAEFNSASALDDLARIRAQLRELSS
ncbi:hypothetical protein [Kribbella catacumbae]|uniref:hypothetical protein n=1 Tax=Kribbella catacumbae TaxID=460086 RepID=UPI000364861A|nr:hypothetical protein [Kribbella catacumbae]